MRRTLLPVVILMAISIIALGTIIRASSEAEDPTIVLSHKPLTEQFAKVVAPVVKTIQLTPNSAGNWRHPGVAEDSKGNRLVIFRSTNAIQYFYCYCPKGGTWSAPKVIANGKQPVLNTTLYSYIAVDSNDRFHCHWENYPKGAVYATFKDGVWTNPVLVPRVGTKYDKTSSLALRSNDEVIVVDCNVVNMIKDIYIHTKKKNETQFSHPLNISKDRASSTQPCVAVDSKDHLFIAWKSDLPYPGKEENLVIFLGEFDENNKKIEDWGVSPNPGWSFLPQVAINSDDKVMTLSSSSKVNDYVSCILDPVTRKPGDLINLNVGLVRTPWHTFFTRLVAHGKDYYATVMSPGRILLLLKFDEATSRWNQIAQISDEAAEISALYSGYDQLLIAWNSWREPTNVFFSTVDVEPFSKIQIKSPIEQKTESLVEERSFFHSKFLNVFTWKPNPDNTSKNITITTHKIYRKTPTEANWVLLASVEGTVLEYEDRYVPALSNYVYAVTCVDDKGHESKIE